MRYTHSTQYICLIILQKLQSQPFVSVESQLHGTVQLSDDAFRSLCLSADHTYYCIPYSSACHECIVVIPRYGTR